MDADEMVIVPHFLECVLGVPCYDFLSRILHHYKLEFVHLNPNGIVHTATFIQFYEAFLGI